jgi:hypothetical protein
MLPAAREQLVAGIVIVCIALGLLFSTMVFCLVRLYRQPDRTREGALFRNNSTQKPRPSK